MKIYDMILKDFPCFAAVSIFNKKTENFHLFFLAPFTLSVITEKREKFVLKLPKELCWQNRSKNKKKSDQKQKSFSLNMKHNKSKNNCLQFAYFLDQNKRKKEKVLLVASFLESKLFAFFYFLYCENIK